MILSDRDIESAITAGDIELRPFYAHRVQPASYDVALGQLFQVLHRSVHTHIDPLNLPPDLMRVVDTEGRPFVIHPGEFVLAVTEEYIRLGPGMSSRLEGKSSLGRVGLAIHTTAGWFDPGFEGTATLELVNVSSLPIILTPGMLIGQFSFMPTSSPAERPYGHPSRTSKYQGQTIPTPGRSV